MKFLILVACLCVTDFISANEKLSINIVEKKPEPFDKVPVSEREVKEKIEEGRDVQEEDDAKEKMLVIIYYE